MAVHRHVQSSPKADIEGCSPNVRFVPEPDIARTYLQGKFCPTSAFIDYSGSSERRFKKWGINGDRSDRRDMVPKLPPLKGLRLFAIVARCGSFKLAAQELNLTPGAVSHGIKSLEKWLNVELFDRTRELVLTPAGRHYLPYINEAMSKIAEGTGEILANNGDSHDTPALLPRSKSDF
jgi:regulatory helix-turn-helix LysR family protein